jgi:enediyne biosynthesis protein E4
MFRQKLTVYVRLVLALGFMALPHAGISQYRPTDRADSTALQSEVHGKRSRAALPQLVDITASTHIRFNHLASPDKKYIVESMSGGVALIDYDRDGWLDIYFTNAPDVDMQLAGKKARSALFHNNRDGTFTDVTDKAGVGYPCWAYGVAAGDYNNDGWPDMLVTCFGGIVLYRNNGDGTFTDVTRQAALGSDALWAAGAAFGDYDGDGFQDLFVSRYAALNLHDLPTFGSTINCQYHGIKVQCGPRGLKGSPDSLYHNNGDGTFTEVSKQSGVDDPKALLGLTAVWSDFNDDGKLDLFVANDGGTNYLYRNDGGGHFTELGLQGGVAVDENGNTLANMGVALGDYQHTGRFSVIISHFSEQYAQLFQNDGNFNFSDVSDISGIARSTTRFVGWGDAFYDVDNDGWLDFIMVNGHVYPQVDQANIGIRFKEPGQLFLNLHDDTFRDVSDQVGPALKVPRVGRGLAIGDLFNDGVQEVVIENLDGEPTILRPEGGAKNHWVSFELAARKGYRQVLNVRVKVHVGELSQMDETRSGGSYLSQSDLRLHFGLGAHLKADKVEVLWPSGAKDILTNLAADQFYCVREGTGIVPCQSIRPTSPSEKE